MRNRTESESDSDDNLRTVSKHLSNREKARKIRQLRKAQKYLQLEINKKNRKTRNRDKNKRIYPISDNPCKDFAKDDIVFDRQVVLHSRQTKMIMEEIRKAFLQQNWEGARVLLGILCSCSDSYRNIDSLLKGCWLLMFAHPNTNLNAIRDFVRFLTGYVLDEDVNKFIRIIFALRQTPLLANSSGHLLHSIKVTHDQEYAIL